MAIRTFGPNAVDREERVDLDRVRKERLARLNGALSASELGALLSFDFANIRYMSSTHIGTWAMDKLIRFALLVRGGEPIVWDSGSAARHHQLHNPWLDYSDGKGGPPTGARAGISTLRGAIHPEAGIAEDVATKIATELREHGLAGEPLGVDLVEMPVLMALRAQGIDVVDGQQIFLRARRTKTPDATFDGERHRLGAGDAARAGAGCVHGFTHAGRGPVRWLETQAPQPPPRHSYRFTRDWDDLREALEEKR